MMTRLGWWFLGLLLFLTPQVQAQAANIEHPTVVINEVGWAGSESDALDEWIELYNPNATAINLAGWTLTDGYPIITFTSAHTIAGKGFLLIERHAAATSLNAAAIFDDVESSLSNSGEKLQLFAPDQTLIDQVWLTTTSDWPAGNAVPRASMERINPWASGTPANWQTGSSVSTVTDSGGLAIVGSPGAQNEAYQPRAGLRIVETNGATQVLEGGDLDHVQVGLGGVTPTAPVTITFTPDNAEVDLGNGAGQSASIVFTPLNATQTQSIAIRAVNDTKVEAFHTTQLSITTRSADAQFDSLNDAYVIVNISDSDALIPTSIIFSEIAWSGTAADPTHEWIELYNPTKHTLSTSNMLIESASGNLRIRLPAIILPPGEFAVLEKGTDDVVLGDLADLRYDYGSLSNLGDTLTLRDEYGELLDTVNLDGGFWGGGTSEPLHRTLERRICPNEAVPLDSEAAWSSNLLIQRNGVDANGNPLNGTPRAVNSYCALNANQTFFGNSVVINEIAWVGTQADYDDEWLELHNPTDTALDIGGYVLTSLTDGTPTITLSAGTQIDAQGYLLLEIDEAATSAPSDVVYENGALYYEGEALALIDATGTIIDTANLNAGPWPAGNSFGYPEFASMERINPTVPGAASNWTTNNAVTRNSSDRQGGRINGTPGAANSATLPLEIPQADVVINELVPIPGTNWAKYGLVTVQAPYEFFELFNPTWDEIDLSNWLVMDADGNVYQFPPPYTIAAQQLLTIPMEQTGFALNNEGDCLTLFTPAFGREVDHICYVDADIWANESISRADDGTWQYDWQPTPSMTNRPIERADDSYTTDDFTPPAYSIGDLRNLPLDSWGQITGQVTVEPGVFGARTLYLQDETGGIKVYLRGEWPALTLGQTVTVWGKLKAYKGNLELFVGDLDQVLVAAPNVPHVPTLQRINTLEGLDGQLVSMSGTVTRVTAHTAIIDDGTGAIRIFFSGLADRPADMREDDRWQITGILSRNEDGTLRMTTRYGDDAQLESEAHAISLYSVGEFNGLNGHRVTFTAQIWRISANTLVLGTADAQLRVFFSDPSLKPDAQVGQLYTVTGKTEFVPAGSARTPGQRLTVTRRQDIVYSGDNYAIDYAVSIEVFRSLDEGVGAVIQGEVIAIPGMFGERSLFLRDSNLRGIRVYLSQGDWPEDVTVGQHVVLYATKKTFHGEIEAVLPNLDHIRWGARHTTVSAKSVHTGNFGPTAGSGIEGDLVQTAGTVIKVTRHTVLIDDGTGPARVFFGKASTGRPADLEVGQVYAATGIVSYVADGGTAIPGYRLTTRTDADFLVSTLPITTQPETAVLGIQLSANTAGEYPNGYVVMQHDARTSGFPTQPELQLPAPSSELTRIQPRFVPTINQLKPNGVLYNCLPNVLDCFQN